MKVDIDSIKKMNIKEGDVIVIHLKQESSKDDLEESMKILKEIFPKTKIVFMPTNMELSIVNEKELS